MAEDGERMEGVRESVIGIEAKPGDTPIDANGVQGNSLQDVLQDESLVDSGVHFSGVAAYEERVSPKLQALGKAIARFGRLKVVAKQAEQLNRGELSKLLQEISLGTDALREQAGSALGELEVFQIAESEADQVEWTRRFIKECAALGRTVEGEYPQFRIFPVDIKVDLTAETAQMGRSTVRAMHPKALASLVDSAVQKLERERFNGPQFLRAMMRAYEVLRAEMSTQEAVNANRNRPTDVPLRQIHALLALRVGTTANGYPLSQFAFDIYRLRRDMDLVIEGNRVVFLETRKPSLAIILPLPGGQKQILGSVDVVPLGDERNV
ncbi:hypothetical protein D2Q93_08820 [Alicyclobacillaceae bacterium I2511]|nr:hypothetical protein D2Q93_08820 [Alicyclobacillaceae bacterium I2511]